MIDPHAHEAITFYKELVTASFDCPPHLAAALAAAKYSVAIQQAPAELPALREIVSAAHDTYPALRRTAGQMLEKIEIEMGIIQTDVRVEPAPRGRPRKVA